MLIVLNADDFGASEETVRATIECFERGALTSATIMPGMPATEAAVAYARSRPDLSFGVHLSFVANGLERPLSDPARLGDLVDDEGRFLATGEARRRALLRGIPAVQIAHEAEAQLAFLRDSGVPVSHVDSHRHMHKLAPFREALAGVLPRFGIRRVRNVQDVWLRRPLRSPTYWYGRVWRRRLMRRFVTTEHFYMPTSAADTEWADALLAAVRRLPGESLEVGVHPGFDEEWRRDEGRTVQAFAERARGEGHTLAPWTEVA
ncbi:MAG: carbohydrate deacetylase [Gaiellaceae bacterium]